MQIRDCAVSYELNSVIILMELAAGDLRCLLKQMSAASSLNASNSFSIWDALVRAVEAAHKENIIHRDLKPDNFLLVPNRCSPFADRILATTSTPPEQFKFRLLTQEDRGDREGDVEVTLTDSATGQEHVLRLSIKLSDFGLSRPLDIGKLVTTCRKWLSDIFVRCWSVTTAQGGLFRWSKEYVGAIGYLFSS